MPKLSDMSLPQQMQIAMIIPLLPFLAGYFFWFILFFFYNMGFFYSGLVGASTGAIGYTVYFGYRDHVRGQLQALIPVNLHLAWSEDAIEWESNMVSGIKILKAEEQRQRGKKRGNPHRDAWTGDYITELEFEREMQDPIGRPFRRADFIDRHIFEKAFHKTLNQIVVSQGQILPSASSFIVCSFCDEHVEAIPGRDEVEWIPVFYVEYSPEVTRQRHMGLGIKASRSVRRKTIEETITLSGREHSIPYARRAREEEAYSKGLTETDLDSHARSFKMSDRQLELEDIIRSRKSRLGALKSKKLWLILAGMGLLIVFLLWLFEVF